MTDSPTLSVENLSKFAADIFVARGFSADHAAKIAEVLVWADLRGAPSHGVQRIPRYIEIIDDGEMNTRPTIRVEKELPAAVLIEADRGPGQVSMRLAAAEAARKARAAGIGLALVQTYDAYRRARLLHAARRARRHGGDRRLGLVVEHGLSRCARGRRRLQSLLDRDPAWERRAAGARHGDGGRGARQDRSRGAQRQKASPKAGRSTMTATRPPIRRKRRYPYRSADRKAPASR